MGYKTAYPDTYLLLKEFARENRKNATLAEQIAWDVLREKFKGQKLLRQHIIGDYIVDLLFLKHNLVIEIDGGYHCERQQMEDDAVRTRFLESKGYRVIRFTNEVILNEIDSVIITINKELGNNVLQEI